MLHGRSAGPRNILELTEGLVPEGYACLAPAAAGGTWYPLSFLAPTERNEPFLSSALSVVGALVDGVEAQGTPADRIVLLGFSQGACLALTAALRRQAGWAARRLGGVIGFSGGLIGPVGTAWDFSGDFQSAPVLLGCSDRDPHIPRDRVEETAQVFERTGAAVTLRLYPGMGHFVNEDERELARALLHAVADPAG